MKTHEIANNTMRARVFPGPKDSPNAVPWLCIDTRDGLDLTLRPDLTRDSAAALRALADDVDAAWAEIDAKDSEVKSGLAVTA